MPFFSKLFLMLSACCGLTATVLGAFGAHGLKGKISESLLHAFQTGVQYQFYHTFALALVALLILHFDGSKLYVVAGTLFLMGILLFSGSLYGLALGAPKWFGPITPLGGLSFILGWASLALAVWKN